MPPPDHPVIFFDGNCNLCNSAVAWIISRDRNAVFRFASLQSPAARQLLDQAPSPHQLPDSIILIDHRGIRSRSDAAIAIASRLAFPWSLATAARIVPRSLRDRLYAIIARNRYRWFGQRDACPTPTPDLAARFLDAGERPAHHAPRPATHRDVPSSH